MGLQRFIQTMRAIQGALIVASSIQIILGYSQVWGLFSRYGDTRKCKKKLSSYFVIDWFSTIRGILQVFQSTWHGTCSWIGWLGIVWTGFSCGKFFYERQFIIPLGWPRRSFYATWFVSHLVQHFLFWRIMKLTSICSRISHNSEILLKEDPIKHFSIL